ncbi:MAG: helix-turn-helix transcriptional regulator [Rhodobacteraceae bacterium]|nr:helix-turn-helix transcriptional regulator [Paracoccaceae bacterium]
MTEDFSNNLRSLCADYGSIAQVCREIGINRQQFNRYLNGGGMPSAHNLRRISRHFEVSERDMMLGHAEFTRRHIQPATRHARNPANLMSDIFKDQARHMRRYLGFYHGYFCTPTWNGRIMRSLIWLREEEGYVVGHTFERAYIVDESVRQKTRYSGLASYRGNRIYVIETAFSDDGFISETILFPAHRQQVNYLRGMTIGVATRPHLAPYSSPTIWKRIPEKVSARQAVDATGIFPTNSTRIDPIIRKFLSGEE